MRLDIDFYKQLTKDKILFGNNYIFLKLDDPYLLIYSIKEEYTWNLDINKNIEESSFPKQNIQLLINDSKIARRLYK